MHKSLQESVSQLIATKNYHEVIKDALLLIVDGKMNSIALNELLASKNIRRISDMKEHTLDVILDYAEMILEDDVLTDEEMTNMRFMKMFFNIQERDFEKNGKSKRVEEILTSQLERLYADNVIDEKEMLHKSDLQGLFGLSYDEYSAIVNKVAEKALQRGANIKDLDTYIKQK